jgi:trk system potassium uptake protein TrkA
MKKYNKNFLVIGIGRFGSKVAVTLADLGYDVLAIDIDEDAIQSIARYVPNCVIADATKKDVLKELIGKNGIDVAVVAIGNNLQASILSIVNLKNLGIENITVRADESDHKELFEMVGATDVIIPEEASAVSLANQITSNAIVDYYNISGEYGMYKLEIGEKFKPKSIIDLNLRQQFEINVIGIIPQGGEIFMPKGQDILRPGDTVVVVGSKDNIDKFASFIFA